MFSNKVYQSRVVGYYMEKQPIMIKIIWISVLTLKLGSTTSINSTLKDFKMERMLPCRSEMDFLILFNGIIPNRPITNKVIMSGAIVVKENITGPIELKVKVTRCNMDMSYCVNYDTIIISTMCSKFVDKASPWSEWAKSFEPKFECPLLENTYTTANASLSLASIAKLPIEGFHWILKLEFFELSKEDNEDVPVDGPGKLLLCLDSDITVRIPRHSRKKHWSLPAMVQNRYLKEII